MFLSTDTRCHTLLRWSLAFWLGPLGLLGSALGQEDPSQQAKLWFLERKWPEARKLQEEVLAAVRKELGEGHAGLIEPLDFLAQLQEFLEDFPAARRSREELVKLAEVLYVQQAWRIGDARRDLARVDRLAQFNSDQRQRLREAHFLLLRAVELGESSLQAADLARQSAEIRAATLGEDPLTARAWAWVGFLEERQRHLDLAQQAHEKSLALNVKLLGENHPSTAASHNNLAAALLALGDFANARHHFQMALSARGQLFGETHPLTLTTLSNLGALALDEGDYVTARPAFEKCLAESRKLYGDDHLETLSSLNNLGGLFLYQGDFAAADPLLRQAYEGYRRALGEAHPQTVLTASNLGALEFKRGRYDQARPYFELVVARRRERFGDVNPLTAHALSNLGLLLVRQGEDAEARKTLEASLASFLEMKMKPHPDTAIVHHNLGLLHFGRGELSEAKLHFDAALQMQRQLLELAAGGQSERQQLAMLQAFRYPLDSFLSLGDSLVRTPVDDYQHILGWRTAIFGRQRALRQSLADPHLAPKAKELQALSIRLAQVAFAAPQPQDRAAWAEQLQHLTAEKERLEGDLAEASVAFRVATRQVLVEDLAKQIPADVALVDFLQYRRQVTHPGKPASWQESSQFVAFIIRRGRATVRVELGAVEPIETAVGIWRTELKQLKQPTSSAARELRRLLWEPLEGHLDGARIVLLSPDGVMNQIPFAALPGKEQGTYLLEERAVAVLPVPRLLPELLERASKTKGQTEGEGASLLLLGDVDFQMAQAGKSTTASAPRRSGTFPEWSALPATRGEIATIRDSFEQRFPDGKSKMLRGGGATKSAFRQAAPHFRMLHLATHGFFAPPEVKSALDRAAMSDPLVRSGIPTIGGLHPGLLSGLVLAGANRPPEPDQDDGIMTALEVGTLELNDVDLVVLSACETGLGAISGGEGILGLQRAFQLAGARSVVTSLWSIDDEATRKLMERFYENLWQKDLAKIDALREAQLWMLREGAERGLVRLDEAKRDAGPRTVPPFYWAAFVLSGDWR